MVEEVGDGGWEGSQGPQATWGWAERVLESSSWAGPVGKGETLVGFAGMLSVAGSGSMSAVESGCRSVLCVEG